MFDSNSRSYENKKSFDEYLEFPKIAANIDGTRAGFYEGDSLTI
jgi:hypothetical protein